MRRADGASLSLRDFKAMSFLAGGMHAKSVRREMVALFGKLCQDITMQMLIEAPSFPRFGPLRMTMRIVNPLNNSLYTSENIVIGETLLSDSHSER